MKMHVAQAKRARIRHGKITLPSGKKLSVPCPYNNVKVYGDDKKVMVICEENHHDIDSQNSQIQPDKQVHIQGCMFPVDERTNAVCPLVALRSYDEEPRTPEEKEKEKAGQELRR